MAGWAFGFASMGAWGWESVGTPAGYYNPATRRGEVHLPISTDLSLGEAKLRSRNAIEEVLRNNGMTPGTLYRSLGETFKDGVLTVEFEAVE